MKCLIALCAVVPLVAACSDSPPPVAPEPTPEIPPADPSEAGLRRLTAAQYQRGIRDLLTPPGEDPTAFAESLGERARLPSERTVHGFEHYGAVQRPSAALVEAHLRGAIHGAGEGPAVCDGEFRGCPEGLFALARRAFRGPLSSQEQEELRTLYRRFEDPFDAAFVSVQWILLHPRFMYLIERGEGAPNAQGRVRLRSHEIAARLSFFLWGTLPDDALLDAADAGQLETRDDIAREATRMLDDRRARYGLVELHRQWLDFARVERLNPDFQSFELFRVVDDPNDAEIAQIRLRELVVAMRFELERFVEMELFEGSGTLRGLLTSTRTYGDDLLRYLYGLGPLPGPDGVVEPIDDCEPGEDPDCEEGGAVYRCADEESCPRNPGVLELDPSRRAGFLTLASHLAAHSYPRDPSPIRRSMFVLERFLCTAPPPPPPGIDPSGVTGGRDMAARTNRERHVEHTANAACRSCHDMIDPIGFSFEHYDAIGGYRTEDNGVAIDASGDLSGLGMSASFNDAVALSQALAESPEVQHCVARQWMRYALGHDLRASDQASLEEASAAFSSNDGSFRALVLAIVQTESFLTREVSR
ncbi:MAG: DUF1592 domain-containing protein [Myxococcota bacterium]